MVDSSQVCPSRRSILTVLGGLTLLPGVLVACSSDDDNVSSEDPSTQPPNESAAVPTGAIPVGAAKVVTVGNESLVVAQPTTGEFVAYSAQCTHQGVIVAVTEGLDLECPAHGSRFDAADGSVQQGPAGTALAPRTVRVEGDTLLIG